MKKIADSVFINQKFNKESIIINNYHHFLKFDYMERYKKYSMREWYKEVILSKNYDIIFGLIDAFKILLIVVFVENETATSLLFNRICMFLLIAIIIIYSIDIIFTVFSKNELLSLSNIFRFI